MARLFSVHVGDDRRNDDPDRPFTARIEFFGDNPGFGETSGIGATPQNAVANLLESYQATMVDLATPPHQKHPLWPLIESYADAHAGLAAAEERGDRLGDDQTILDNATRDLANALNQTQEA